MMAAEKWYEYQDSYKRYGFDMKPKTEKKENIKSKNSNTSINNTKSFQISQVVNPIKFKYSINFK